jgi:hypothetical protein
MCEPDHSPPANTEAMNGGGIPPLLHMPSGVVLNCVFKSRGNIIPFLLFAAVGNENICL